MNYRMTYFIFYIIFTTNNIFYLITDLSGNILVWVSHGQYRIKGLKKISINSIKLKLKFILKFLRLKKISLFIKLKGVNRFKKLVLKYLKQSLILNTIVSIEDEILIPHNGCRLKKKRRL